MSAVPTAAAVAVGVNVGRWWLARKGTVPRRYVSGRGASRSNRGSNQGTLRKKPVVAGFSGRYSPTPRPNLGGVVVLFSRYPHGL